MSKLLSLAGLGLLAACFMLATPSVSNAGDHGRHYHRNGYGRSGFGFNYAPSYGFRFSYNSNNFGYGRDRYWNSGYGQYNHWRNDDCDDYGRRDYGRRYNGYPYYRR